MRLSMKAAIDVAYSMLKVTMMKGFWKSVPERFACTMPKNRARYMSAWKGRQ